MSDELCEACGKPHNHPNHFSSVQGTEHFFVPSKERAAPPPANDELRTAIANWAVHSKGEFCEHKTLEDCLVSFLQPLLAQVAARARAETAKKFRQNVLDRATVPIESDLRRWMDSEWDELQKAVTGQ